MITIEEALRIAIDVHEGQKDLDGKPVILHPLAVGMAGRNRQEIIAGFLHDIGNGVNRVDHAIRPTHH